MVTGGGQDLGADGYGLIGDAAPDVVPDIDIDMGVDIDIDVGVPGRAGGPGGRLTTAGAVPVDLPERSTCSSFVSGGR